MKPDVDIKIEYTGLRPGEKLFEELLMNEEGLKSTDNKKIFIGNQIAIDEDNLLEKGFKVAIGNLYALIEYKSEVKSVLKICRDSLEFLLWSYGKLCVLKSV